MKNNQILMKLNIAIQYIGKAMHSNHVLLLIYHLISLISIFNILIYANIYKYI